MLKRTVFALCLAAGMLQAQNIVQDPEFDNGTKDLKISHHLGCVKYSIITEENGNKCLAIENVQYKVDAKSGRKATYCEIRVGMANGKVGFKAEPNTVYEFQFQFKGDIVPLIDCYLSSTPDIWKGKKKAVKLEKPLAPSKEWVTVKGTFTTEADTQCAVLHMEMFAWDTRIPLGPSFMLDKLQIVKKGPAQK